MSLRIQTNVEAFNAQRHLASTTDKIATAMERLSSGYRINRAADDAAGLSISEKLTAQINGLDQAGRNSQDAVSLVQTAEGSLDEVHEMLQRVRELAVQYKNGTLSASDRLSIQSEVNQLSSEIERIGSSVEFNGIALLSSSGTVTFQVGANDGEVITVSTISLGQTVGTAAFGLTATGAAPTAAGSPRSRRSAWVSPRVPLRSAPGHGARRTSRRSIRRPPPSARSARSSVRCRTASSTR